MVMEMQAMRATVVFPAQAAARVNPLINTVRPGVEVALAAPAAAMRLDLATTEQVRAS
jgi:hypothetical protein